MQRWAQALLLALAVLMAPAAAAAGVQIVAGDDVPLVGALRQALNEAKDGRALRLCVGAKACRESANNPTAGPLLAVGVSPADLAGIPVDAALYYEPDPLYQFRLAAALFGTNAETAVLLGPTSIAQQPSIQKAATRAHVGVSVLQASDDREIGRSLPKIASAAALIAVHDPDLYATERWRTLILGSYRHDVPLIGYSPALIQAGAIGGVVVRDDKYLEAVLATVQQFLRSGDLPGRRYPSPDQLTIQLHAAVVKSFGLAPDVNALEQKVLQ